MQIAVRYLNPRNNCYGEGAEFALVVDDKEVAVMKVSFTDEHDFSTAADFRSHLTINENLCPFSPLKVSAIIQHTIISNWDGGADSFEHVFRDGDLVVS